MVAEAGAFVVEEQDGGSYGIRQDGALLTWSGFGNALRESPALRKALTIALSQTTFRAFFWECCPWPQGRDPAFEYVVLDAAARFSGPAAFTSFRSHFEDDERTVRHFPNLRGDAVLVVPKDLSAPTAYGHLAAFLRGGPAAQVELLWKTLGVAIFEWQFDGRGTLWLSTAGLGVPWLHLRLDSRPKYYRHAEYRDPQ